MKFLKKIVFIPVLGLVLAGCNPSSTATVTVAVANERVARAMGQTALSGTLNSLTMSLSGDLDLTVANFDAEDTLLNEMSLESSATLDLKAKDLGKETMAASLVATASLKLVEDDEEVFNESVTASAYLSEMWLYLNATGVGELLGMEEADLKGKVNVEGMLDLEALPVPTTELTSAEFEEMTGMLETMLMEVETVSAKETNGDLVVTYTITLEDIVDIIVAAATFDNSEMTTSEIEAFRQEGMTELAKLVKINSAKVVVGVSKLGYLNRLDVDVDVILTIENYESDYVDYEYVEVFTGKTVVHIDTLVAFAMDINGNVTITLPTDLDTYPLIEESQNF